jgi:hypothetical protein
MIRKQWKFSDGGRVMALLILLTAIFLKAAYVENEKYYWALLILVPLLFIAIWNRVAK